MIIDQLLIVYIVIQAMGCTKICMRISMVRNRLNLLSIHNIEHELSKSIDIKDIILKFA